jgi:septum formation protein
MLVLASASPRRQQLLRDAGISFTVEPANINEAPQDGESPRDCAQRLAREKVLAVSDSHPHDFILGADTVVAVDDIVLGKPVDPIDAARMLRLLSGRTHQVITGVCLLGPIWPAPAPSERGRSRQAGENSSSEKTLARSRIASRNLTVTSETTLVTMLALSDREINDYIATGEPMDKAGAYAIQGAAARWIPRIEGNYSNVVGLPIALVCRLLRDQEGM